jgi:hypothetical protein
MAYIIRATSQGRALYISRGRHMKAGLIWTADRAKARRFASEADATPFLERARAAHGDMAPRVETDHSRTRII